jgi:RimJ/RimL family protein N-acetyltransferase
MDRLRERGSPGVHLGMWARNTRAHAFYQRLGFRELTRVGTPDTGSIYMGRRLALESAGPPDQPASLGTGD